MPKTLSILGSGWLGQPLAEFFAQQGYRIQLSTRKADKISHLIQPNIKPYRVDIDALTDIQEFLQSETLIINITSKNIDGFEALISQIKQSPIQHILFISSSSVYQNTNAVVTEDDNSAENHDSPLWKIEQLFRDEVSFKTTILRFSGLIDNRRHPGHFFRNGKVVQQADAPVNLIHFDDCVGIINAIIRQQAWGDVFNGCADSHPTKRQFYSHARQLLSKPTPEFADNTTLAYKIVSNEKVKTKLNYKLQQPDLMNINFK